MRSQNWVGANRAWFAVAALLVGVLSARAAINFEIGDKHQYVPAYVATAAATFYLGRRAGIAVAIGGLLIGEFFGSTNPIDSAFTHVMEAFAGYLAMSWGIVWVALRLRMDGLRAQESAAKWRQADHDKDAFIALLAYELRSPLASLQMGQALLEEEGLGGPAAARTLAMLQRQTRSMSRIVSHLLDASKLHCGKMNLEYESVDVATAVGDAIVDVSATTRLKCQTVVVGTEGVAGILEADPLRLHQMLLNLLHNAAKFSAAGAEIEITVIGRAHWVTISVADSGVGIDSSELRRIFEPYAQGRARESRGGLGLGLPLTRELAQLHGGTLHGFSAGVGRGSEFLLCLPRSRLAHVPAREFGGAAAAPAVRPANSEPAPLHAGGFGPPDPVSAF